MERTIGVWTLELGRELDYVLVTQENFEILKLYTEENNWHPSCVYLLNQNVKQNEGIFAWCIQRTILEDSNITVHAATQDTESAQVISLLENFLIAFKQLDIERCNSILSTCSSINFSRFYLHKTQWLLEQLANFAAAIRSTFIDQSPVLLPSTVCKTWWDQPLVIKSTLESSRNSISLKELGEVDSLKQLVYIFDQVSKAAGEWGGYHNKAECHEPASGYLLALANYWFLNNQIPLAVLLAHRGIDFFLHFLALKDDLITPTVEGLVYNDTRERVSFSETLKCLNRIGKFTTADKKLIRQLNDVRNHLREIHGLYVVGDNEIKQIMKGIDKLLLRFISETKVGSIREKFNFALNLDLRVFFDIEIALDSYLIEQKLTG